eukprot:RCo018689
MHPHFVMWVVTPGGLEVGATSRSPLPFALDVHRGLVLKDSADANRRKVPQEEVVRYPEAPLQGLFGVVLQNARNILMFRPKGRFPAPFPRPLKAWLNPVTVEIHQPEPIHRLSGFQDVCGPCAESQRGLLCLLRSRTVRRAQSPSGRNVFQSQPPLVRLKLGMVEIPADAHSSCQILHKDSRADRAIIRTPRCSAVQSLIGAIQLGHSLFQQVNPHFRPFCGAEKCSAALLVTRDPVIHKDISPLPINVETHTVHSSWVQLGRVNRLGQRVESRRGSQDLGQRCQHHGVVGRPQHDSLKRGLRAARK